MIAAKLKDAIGINWGNSAYRLYFAITATVTAIAIFFISMKLHTSLPGKLYAYEKNKIFDSLMSRLQDYELDEAYYTRIYYTNEDYDYVNTIKESIDFYLPLLAVDYHLDLEQLLPVQIIVYSDKQEMSELLGLGASDDPMGLYYCGVINILSPRLWIDTDKTTESNLIERFVKEGPILHELSHFLTDIKTNGNYSTWLTEGIALYYENKYTGFEWRSDLKDEASSITYENLNKNFRYLEESVAYRRSYDIINNYVTNNSEGQLQQLIAELGAGD